MAKLSGVLSSKRKKTQDNSKSMLVSRMATRKVSQKSPDEVLLGDLFIKADTDNIIDVASDREVINARATTKANIKDVGRGTIIVFDGDSSNINVKDDGLFKLGIDDFSLDWWEFKLPLPEPNYEDIDSTQYSLYKNSVDKKEPFKVRNTKYKSIYLSSDGDHWDIADDKYMGEVEENNWTHWAIVRCNTNFYTFKNGIIKNIWTSDLSVNTSEEYFTVGSGPSGNYFYGYMDKVRFVKGTALWTEEFNPLEELFY